jgi:hypothetical protein
MSQSALVVQPPSELADWGHPESVAMEKQRIMKEAKAVARFIGAPAR